MGGNESWRGREEVTCAVEGEEGERETNGCCVCVEVRNTRTGLGNVLQKREREERDEDAQASLKLSPASPRTTAGERGATHTYV